MPDAEKVEHVEKTELGDGKAIILYTTPTTPKNGTVRVHAIFEGPVTHRPGTARFVAKLNGVIIKDQSDYDFSNYYMGCDAKVPTNANTTITFDTYRNNTSADTAKWEMWLEFTPSP